MLNRRDNWRDLTLFVGAKTAVLLHLFSLVLEGKLALSHCIYHVTWFAASENFVGNVRVIHCKSLGMLQKRGSLTCLLGRLCIGIFSVLMADLLLGIEIILS